MATHPLLQWLNWESLLALFLSSFKPSLPGSKEEELLQNLQHLCQNLNLPQPEDVREKLAVNRNVAPWKKRDVAQLKGLVIHQELGWGTVEAVAEYHTGAKSHLRAGGVRSISYTLAIRKNGHILLCNSLDEKTWSQGTRERAGDENAEFMSVMLEGHFYSPHDTEAGIRRSGEPTQQQLLSSLILWQACQKMWQWDASQLYGHFDFGKAACPGETLERMILAIRSGVRGK